MLVAIQNSNPSWFGFLITVKEIASFSRSQLVQKFESNKIATRLLFGGNLLCQPAYKDAEFRVVGETTSADRVMNQTLRVGVYPGLGETQYNYTTD